MALLVLAPFAFWPSYLSRSGSSDAYTHAHAALGTLWLLLLVVQPWFIKASRRSWHRYAGRLGVLLGTAFFATSVLVAHRSIARMSAEQFSREGHLVYLPLAMAALFGLALLMAVRWRRNAPLHGRFMAATALALLDPLFARLLYFYAPPLPREWLYQIPAFVLSVSILAALFMSLPTRAPGRMSFLGFSVGVTAVLLGFFVIPHTATWLSLVTWFQSLPMT